MQVVNKAGNMAVSTAANPADIRATWTPVGVNAKAAIRDTDRDTDRDTARGKVKEVAGKAARATI